MSSVFLARKNSIHTWWTGIIGCVLYGIMFFEVKLYADVTLQFFFLGTSVYGWWNWKLGGTNRTELKISTKPWQTHVLLTLLASVSTAAYGFLLHSKTDASFPFIDSIILMFSILAQFLAIGRVVSTWYFWIIVNIVSVPLYWVKDLKLTSFVYFLFLLNAFWGLHTWKKILKEQSL